MKLFDVGNAFACTFNAMLGHSAQIFQILKRNVTTST